MSNFHTKQYNMTCENCPYIQDEYEIRERYFENNNDNFLTPGISSSCHCDKVGGKLDWFGYCEDATHYHEPNYQLPPISSRKEKARKRRKNDIKSKQAICNGMAKKFKDSKKTSVIYKKLKPLLKEKHKS